MPFLLVYSFHIALIHPRGVDASQCSFLQDASLFVLHRPTSCSIIVSPSPIGLHTLGYHLPSPPPPTPPPLPPSPLSTIALIKASGNIFPDDARHVFERSIAAHDIDTPSLLLFLFPAQHSTLHLDKMPCVVIPSGIFEFEHAHFLTCENIV